MQAYQLKPTTGKFNVHINKYTESQLSVLKEKCAHLLYLFGYVNHPD